MPSILNILLIVLFVVTLKAQPLHTPLLYDDISLVDSSILKIKSVDTTIRSISITSEEFYINYTNGTSEKFDLEDKKLIDLCNAVNYKLEDKLHLFTDYPEIDAVYLEDQVINLVKDVTKEVKYERSKALVNIDFGGLFSIANKQSLLSSENLLSQAGYNLDLTIFRRFKLSKHFDISLTPRLGLASNINYLAIDSIQNNNTSSQIESAIQQANSGVLSLQFEIIFNKILKNSGEFSIYGETGITYNRPDAIDIESRQVKLYNHSDSVNYVQTGEYFTRTTLENFKAQSTRAFPLGFGEIGLSFKFIKNKKMIGYMCFGYGTSPEILRSVRTNYKGVVGILDSTFLEYFVLQNEYNDYFRPKLGMKIGNLIDIKAEALIPITKTGIDRNSRQNIFRILITKEFPIKK